MRIVVSKTGMPATTLAYRNATGETGETEGLIRHLINAGHTVTYLGMWTGDPVPGCKVVAIPEHDSLDEMSSFEEQKAVCEGLANEAGPQDAFVDMCGSGAGRSWICDGPLMPARAWYINTAVSVCAIGMLNVPRICCITDIRCYPHELDWREPERFTAAPKFPSLMPVAVLSQITREQKVFALQSRGQTWLRREVYAGIENWDSLSWWSSEDQHYFSHDETVGREERAFYEANNLPEAPKAPYRKGVNGIAVIAHAHIKTGFRQRKRDDAFANLFKNMPALRSEGLVVHGEGWEHFSGYDKRVMRGKIPMKLIPALLRRSRCGVMVPPESTSWVTSKVGLYARQCCSPIFYGRGEDFTYDTKGRYMPLDHEFRASSSEDLVRIHRLPQRRHDDHIEDMQVKTRPEFKRLDACLAAIDAKEDRNTEQWWQRYGGHRKVTR